MQYAYYIGSLRMTPEEFQVHVCAELNELRSSIVTLNAGQVEIKISTNTLDVGQKHVIDHLAKLNGSVKELYFRTEQNKDEIRNHKIDCPVKEKIQEFSTSLASGNFPVPLTVRQELEKMQIEIRSQEVEKKNSEKWWGIIRPLIWIAVGLALSTLGNLLLLHSDKLIK
jgi:hypothetical protein